MMHVLIFGPRFEMFSFFILVKWAMGRLSLASQMKGAWNQGHLDELVVIKVLSTFETTEYVRSVDGIVD